MSFNLPVTFRVPAYVSWARYVADCPRCPNAELVARFQAAMMCTECGARAELEWPSEEMVYGIERLLLMRPSVANQSWLPGETLLDLVAENASHGILTPLPDDYDWRLVVEPERIRMDNLPATHRRELGAA